MSLPFDLQKLPPRALDVIRFLDDQPEGADVPAIMTGTALSERGLGKVLRRLVTRHYVEMRSQGVYGLTNAGREAAQTLRSDESAPEAAAAGPGRHERRLSVLVAQELVIDSTAVLLAGFDAPVAQPVMLRQPARMILRISAPGCEIVPPERPLEVAPDRAAGPAQFRITPHHEGPVRITVEAAQLVAADDVRLQGGLYFDLYIAGFPTPRSAEFHTLGATVGLHPGA